MRMAHRGGTATATAAGHLRCHVEQRPRVPGLLAPPLLEVEEHIPGSGAFNAGVDVVPCLLARTGVSAGCTIDTNSEHDIRSSRQQRSFRQHGVSLPSKANSPSCTAQCCECLTLRCHVTDFGKTASLVRLTAKSYFCAWDARLVHVLGVQRCQRAKQRVRLVIIPSVAQVNSSNEGCQHARARWVVAARIWLRIYQNLCKQRWCVWRRTCYCPLSTVCIPYVTAPST